MKCYQRPDDNIHGKEAYWLDITGYADQKGVKKYEKVLFDEPVRVALTIGINFNGRNVADLVTSSSYKGDKKTYIHIHISLRSNEYEAEKLLDVFHVGAEIVFDIGDTKLLRINLGRRK